MDEHLYRKAVELREGLRAELEQNETFRRLQHAEAIVASWERSQQLAAAEPRRAVPTVKTHLPGSATSKIVQGAVEYLRSKGARAASGEIHRALSARGIEVRGKDPLKSTSSYLSHSPLFNNVPGEGYGLAEWSITGNQSPQRSREPTKAQRILNAIREFVEPRGTVHRMEILDHLTAAGLMDGIVNPMANLAAFISDHKEFFVSHGGGRWSLASEPKSEAPNSSELSGAPKPNGTNPLGL
jgi:hypothetical protein